MKRNIPVSMRDLARRGTSGRVAVWLVVVTAVVGNVTVLVVLVNRSFKLTTPKFLMCNLALADLVMGVYLLLIASMDLHTIGVYFSHAIDWQEGGSPACVCPLNRTIFGFQPLPSVLSCRFPPLMAGVP